jgi:hypothetical protein
MVQLQIVSTTARNDSIVTKRVPTGLFIPFHANPSFRPASDSPSLALTLALPCCILPTDCWYLVRQDPCRFPVTSKIVSR